MRIIIEEFENINSLLRTICSRPNNKIMEDEDSSRSNDKEFTGTETWNDAVKLLRTGYTEILGEVKEQLVKITKQNKKFNSIKKSRIKNDIIGYVPNVPNSIMNLPESMINIKQVPQKRKTLSILYSIEGNANESVEFFIKTGIILIAAINTIEKSGIQVKLSVAFMTSEKDEEITFPIVCIKNYGQRFDLQKICFPLAHPSMLRRIGFKWLETTPEITARFNYGYGKDPKDLTPIIEECKKRFGKDTYVLNSHWIRSNKYSVEKVLNYLDFNKKDA